MICKINSDSVYASARYPVMKLVALSSIKINDKKIIKNTFGREDFCLRELSVSTDEMELYQ